MPVDAQPLCGQIRFWLLREPGYRAPLAALAGELWPEHWHLSVNDEGALVEVLLEGPPWTHDRAAEIVTRALPSLPLLADLTSF